MTQTDAALAAREAATRFWHPGPKLLRALRDYQSAKGETGPVARLRKKIAFARWWFWSTISQCELHPTTEVGWGLKIPHPNGIVIHPESVIGAACMIMHQVTLGTTDRREGAPRLGDRVDIGAGAKILGPVTIGDDARIGANAVVLIDVPAGATAVGAPARIIDKRADAALEASP